MPTLLKHLWLVGSFWLCFGWLAYGEPSTPQADQLTRILELCTRNADPKEINEAMQRLTGRATGIYAEKTHQNPDFAHLNAEITIRHSDLILRQLGYVLLDKSSKLSGGLPSLEAIPHPERLGPFFSAIMPYFKDISNLKTNLSPLERHIPDDWMIAAERCSAVDFIHCVRACRGQAAEVLASYQKAGNESGILRLGEMVGTHPGTASVIRPEDFTSRTLALMLAGALGIQGSYPYEHYLIMEKAVAWSTTHPSLYDEWSSMVSNAAVCPWYEIMARFHRGQRVEALQALVDQRMAPKILAKLSPQDAEKSNDAVFAMDCYKLGFFIRSLLTSATCPEDKLPEIVRVLPTDLVLAAINAMLAHDDTSDEARWRSVLLLPELQNRKDVSKPLRIHIRRSEALEIAERWSKSGQSERSRRLIEASAILQP